MRIYFALFFLSLGFFIVHCEKETSIVPVEKMGSFNPEFYFEPIMVPKGLSSSPDSMAQVVNHFLNVANSVQDYKRFYARPEDYDVRDIKRTNKTGLKLWELSFVTQGIEMYDSYISAKLQVIEEQEMYYWKSLLTFKCNGHEFLDFPYLELSTTKDFKSGYMRKRSLYVATMYEGHCEWEIDKENEEYHITVVRQDLGDIVYPEWDLFLKTPGKAEIFMNSSMRGNMTFYRIENFDLIQDFTAYWSNDGSGKYWSYGEDKNGNIAVVDRGKW